LIPANPLPKMSIFLVSNLFFYQNLTLSIASIAIKIIAATAALAGMVIIHAYTIRFAMGHLTAENLLLAPVPMIAPEIECVVNKSCPTRY
jgi:hypothetical protein